MNKHLVIISALTLSVTVFAKPSPKPAELNEAQLSQHFDFRAKAYKEAKASSQNRKPASEDQVNDMASEQEQTEQRAILADFRKQVGTSFQILEKIGQYRENGGKKESIAAMIPELVAKQIANKKSLTYKALRFQQIQSIDGRNQDGGFQFPVEAKSIKVFGPMGESVDLRERCSYDEKKMKETKCSQGWNQWSYLVAVHAESCHNSGCDTSPNLLDVAITYVPAVYDSSNGDEKTRPKLLKAAHYEVAIQSLIETRIPDLPKTEN